MFRRENKVRHENPAPYKPEEIGKVVRKWGNTTGTTRCLLDNVGLGKEYWNYAMNYASYIKYCCRRNYLLKEFKEPKPIVSFVKDFGCKALASLKKSFKKT